MNEKVNINKIDGSSITADLICFIENTTTGKRYIYYTLNEVVGAGTSSTVKIYVSKIKQDNPTLDAPITEEEWGILKGYMGDALKGNSNPAVKYIPMSELVNPTSVSERAIAMPTSYDYINKQRGIYATSVAGANTDAGAQNTPVIDAVNPAPAPIQDPVPAAPNPGPAPVEPQVSAPEPAGPTPSPTPAPIEPVAPTPEPAPAPTVAPVVEPPVSAPTEVSMSEAPVTPIEPAPTPVEPAVPIKAEEPATIEPQTNNTGTDGSNPSSAAVLKPIDINEIETKYAEMTKNLENLKNLEIEAAKRYNATIQLQEMHNEQHASYIENEQAKAAPIAGSPIVEPTPSPAPAPAPAPTPEAGPVPTVAPVANPAPIQEPTPVTPVTPEPVAPAPADIETNWFDMPANNA